MDMDLLQGRTMVHLQRRIAVLSADDPASADPCLLHHRSYRKHNKTDSKRHQIAIQHLLYHSFCDSDRALLHWSILFPRLYERDVKADFTNMIQVGGIV